MSTALIVKENNLALNEIMTLGDVFKASGYFKDVRDQAQAVVKILYGRELGFSPVVSMMGVYIVDGKPSMAANLLASAVKRSGRYDYRVLKNTNTECSILFKGRTDDGKWEEIGTTDFTMEDAKTAKVAHKDNWVKYPKAMLFARAMSAGVRAHCPDVTTCPAYVPEELGADVNEDGEMKTVTAPHEPEKKAQPLSFKKSAAAVEDTARKKIGGEHGVQDGKNEGTIMAGTVQAAETHPALPVEEQFEPPSEPHSVEYISIGQQKNFHIECRKAVRETKKMRADDLAYQYLMDNGFVNEKGEPTAAMIRADQWPDVRIKACKWLAAQ